MKSAFLKPLPIALVSTYPPRQCGIATFTADLVGALVQVYASDSHGSPVQIVAICNAVSNHTHPPEVHFIIREGQKGDYSEAADFLNLAPIDVVSLQHEYGIFGGEDGNHIIHLLGNLKKPVVTTLHTVIREPTPGQHETLKTICELSTLVVVQARHAISILTEVYGVPEEKIVMIHHGAPDVPFLDTSYYKEQFQAEGRPVILTFGLLNPNKGIEYAIEAMSRVVKEFPDVLYIVLGATHPEVKRRYGEQYRLSLERLVKENGLEQHVVFHNRFVTLEQLIQFLLAADIYLTPYLSKEQIVSGTLAYAVACGKAIISTPYWYAEELLAEGRGRLVPFRSSDALADQLIELLRDDSLRNQLRRQAYKFGRQMIWREVATEYAKAFERALVEYGRQTRAQRIRRRAIEKPSIPEIDLRHLETLTDNTGLLQHAIFTTPDLNHGYCTDDNARALVMTVMNWQIFQDEDIFRLLQIYLAFLNHALDRKSGRVRNFMAYDRRWLEEVGSEDSHGRTVWALGHAVAHAPTDAILGLTTQLFKLAIQPCGSFTSPRAWAYSILGCVYYLQRFGGDTEARNTATELSQRLLKLFKDNSTADWPWCEDIVTYDNARLPQSLIAAGRELNDRGMLRQGLRSLRWLLRVQTDPAEGHLSIIGNKGWLRRDGERAHFDQQPIEVTALVDACYEALLAEGKRYWREEMDRCFAWFFGRNDLHEALYDFSTGGCFDGLQPAGVNRNQGGESTVCWLLALHRMHQIAHQSVL